MQEEHLTKTRRSNSTRHESFHRTSLARSLQLPPHPHASFNVAARGAQPGYARNNGNKIPRPPRRESADHNFLQFSTLRKWKYNAATRAIIVLTFVKFSAECRRRLSLFSPFNYVSLTRTLKRYAVSLIHSLADAASTRAGLHVHKARARLRAPIRIARSPRIRERVGE